MQQVWNGIDQPEQMDRELKGQRLGVVSGGGAVDKNLCPAVDVLCRRYQVTALFNTIYGIRGEFMYGERVPSYVDRVTGMEVESIFNRERIAPRRKCCRGWIRLCLTSVRRERAFLNTCIAVPLS